MRDDEVIAYWGASNLARWQRSSLEGSKLTARSIDFLCNVGLPKHHEWSLSFEIITRVPLREAPHRWPIGFDEEVPLCIDEVQGGALFALEHVVGGTERFINSSIEQFGESLVLYETYRRAVVGVGEQTALRLAEEARTRLTITDPRAFDTPEHWWSCIVEQMKDGLL